MASPTIDPQPPEPSATADGDPIDAIRARRAAITGSKWYQVGAPWDYGVTIRADNEDPHAGRFVASVLPFGQDDDDEFYGERDELADAKFIAHAPQDIDWLIAALTEAEARAETLDHFAAEIQGENVTLVAECARLQVENAKLRHMAGNVDFDPGDGGEGA